MSAIISEPRARYWRLYVLLHCTPVFNTCDALWLLLALPRVSLVMCGVAVTERVFFHVFTFTTRCGGA